jgi:hypothetical protein
LLSVLQDATLFSQHTRFIAPFTGVELWSSSIPQLAFSPVKEYFTAASSPEQICEATVRCNPERRMSDANNMENSFFIRPIIRESLEKIANKRFFCAKSFLTRSNIKVQDSL